MSSDEKLSLAGIVTGVGMFLLPFVTSRNLFYGAINAKYFFVGGLVCFLLLILAWRSYQDRPVSWSIGKNWLFYSIVAVLAIRYVSAISGVYFWRSIFSEIVRSDGILFLSIVFLFVFCLKVLTTTRDWDFIRRSIVISGGLFALFTYFGYGGLNTTVRLFTINFGIPGLTFGNDTFAAAYVLLSIFLTVIEITRSWGSLKKRYIYGALFLVQVFSPLFVNLSVLFSGDFISNPLRLVGSARASSATLFLVLVNLVGFFTLRYFCRQQIKNKMLMVWSSLWFVGFIAAIVMLLIPGSIVQHFYLSESSEARPVVWEMSLSAIKEKPLLGWGPSNFQFAFQRYFDNRLYLERGGGETWFDKAHNFTIDTLVETGFVGLFSIIILSFLFIRTVIRANEKGVVTDLESYVLSIMVFAHIFQLQTSFDTVATYIFVGVMLGYGVWLHDKIETATIVAPGTNLSKRISLDYAKYSKFFAVIALVAFCGVSFVVLSEYSRQHALIGIFRTTDIEIQNQLLNKTLSRVSDFESLRLSSSSFIKGSLSEISSPNHDPKLPKVILSQLEKYESYYAAYLEEAPNDYRARMNYSYVLLMESTLGKNKIAEAKKMIAESYVLSPNNPLTYAIEAVADLYAGDLKRSKIKSEEMLALNPDSPFSKEVADYLERQSRQFPTITVLRLENL